jgi:hypothetical protein
MKAKNQNAVSTAILLLILVYFLSSFLFRCEAQFITAPEDDINTQFGVIADPTVTDSGAQVGVFATLVMNWGYIEAGFSVYSDPDPERVPYRDLVGELGLNCHLGGFEPIRYFGGFRLGYITRDNEYTYPMFGAAIGFDWRVTREDSPVDIYVGVKLWTDYREDQKDQFYGSAEKYERGLVTNNPLLQENGGLRLSFSF